MTTFTANNTSTAVVRAPRGEIWAILTDPDKLAELTPLVRSIDADGDTWVWSLAGIKGLGMEVAPTFTEQMDFTPEERIDYAHTPPQGSNEWAGADGWYRLEDHPTGTTVSISITLHVDLPLPRLSTRAVEGVMNQAMVRTGDAFARNLDRELGVRS